MTNQTPAPGASSVSALLASFSNTSNAPAPTVKEDFLAVIVQALTGRSGKTPDHAASSQPANDKDKPSLPVTTTPTQDAAAVSMLLALMAPPLPNLPAPAKLVAAPKTGGSAPVPPADGSTPSTPGSAIAQSASENKPGKALAVAMQPVLPEQKVHEGKALPQDGTTAANTAPRMSFSTERHEVAGAKEQKLPITAISAASSADTGGSPSNGGGTKLPMSMTWHEASSEQLAIINLSTKASGPAALETAPAVDVPIRIADPMDRLAQVISSEALTLRQIGAQSLGVSLKLDANTQIFLQLTNNNGAMQALVRCEKGQFAPDDAQWAQLRQSLAQQNVELMPMSGAAGSNMNFQQSAGGHSRQPAASREEWPVTSSAVKPIQQRKQQQKEQSRSRKNWESWA